MGKYYTVISSDGRYYDFFYDRLTVNFNKDCIYEIGNAKHYQLMVKANFNKESKIHEVSFKIGEVIK